MDAEEHFTTSPSSFFEELHGELIYYQRTKIITMLDIYRIRRIMLPFLQVWLNSKEKTFDSILNKQECILLHALREESCLSDVTKLVNDNKYMLRGCFKAFIETLPKDI